MEDDEIEEDGYYYEDDEEEEQQSGNFWSNRAGLDATKSKPNTNRMGRQRSTTTSNTVSGGRRRRDDMVPVRGNKRCVFAIFFV